VRTLTTFTDRSYEVRVPPTSDGGQLPVLLMLHGGGGNREGAWTMSCPGGDAGSPDCLGAMALGEGFLVVTPEGTPQGSGPLLSRLRTWNAGGGDGGWQCVSGRACADAAVDEALYFGLLLADLRSVTNADPQRVFATGLSNGAALSHRLACQVPAVRAIASVAGGNQFATTERCPGRAAIIEVHGTDDPCWSFDGGPASCADANPGVKVSVPATMEGWATRNGCQLTRTTTLLADAGPGDPTTTLERRWNGCPAGLDVVLLEVTGGGHTWPRGAEPRNTSSGVVSQGISANRVMLDFFKAR
jgi:polyhydroxybutyrate depolymerase